MKRKIIIGIVISMTVLSIPAGFTLGGVTVPLGLTDTAQAASSDNIYVNASAGSGGSGAIDDPFATIQAGVNNASDGDKIIVAGGTYEETVFVNKSVTIFTNETAILDGDNLQEPDPEYGFNITNTTTTTTLDNVTITGFEVKNYSSGILVDGTNPAGSPALKNITVYNNSIHNVSSAGISVNYFDGDYEEVKVVNNTVTNANIGVFVNASQGISGNNTQIIGNNVSQEIGETGIQLQSSSTAVLTNVSVIGNNASSAHVGMSVDVGEESNVSELNITANRFSDTKDGLSINATDNASVSNINITKNALNQSSGESTIAAGLRGLTEDSGEISDVYIHMNNISHNPHGVYLVSSNTSQIADVNISDNIVKFNNQSGVYLWAGDWPPGTATASLSNITVKDNAINETKNGAGIDFWASGHSTITDTNLESLDLRNNSHGVRAMAFNSSQISGLNLSADLSNNSVSSVRTHLEDDATLQDLNISKALISGSQSGVQLLAGHDAEATTTISGVSISEAGLNDTTDDGLFVRAQGQSKVSDIALDSVDASNNTEGVKLSATQDAIIDSVDVTDSLLNENDKSGVSVYAGQPDSSSNATVSNITLNNLGLNDSIETGSENEAGLSLKGWGNSSISDVDIDNASLENNTVGLRAHAMKNSAIQNLSVESALLSDNSNTGASLIAGDQETDQALIHDVNFTVVGLNQTSEGPGLSIKSDGKSSVTNISVNTAEVSDNEVGWHTEANDESEIANLSVDSALFNNNNQSGLAINATEQASVNTVDLQTVAVNDTQNAPGIVYHANGSASITDLTAYQVITKGNPVGTRVLAEGDSTISELNFTNTLTTENDNSGLELQAGTGTDDTARIDEVSITANAFNDTASGPGLIVHSEGTSKITNVTAFQNAFFANQDGLQIGANDESTIQDLNVTQALIQDSGQNGVKLGGGTNGNHDNVQIEYSLIENSGWAAVNVTPDSDLSDVAVNYAILSNNARGVDNQNTDSNLDARWNWWGASSGPSSQTDTDAPFEDPTTGKLANGDGDSVSEGSTSGVSNVNFDPAIGGKNRFERDSQLINPIPTQSFSIEVAGQTITGDVGDFIGLSVWERSPLPLRANHEDAATKVYNVKTELKIGDNSLRLTGIGSNRPYLKVYEQNEPLRLDFENITTGDAANTSRFANKSVKLLAVRANDSLDISGANTTLQSVLNVTNTNTSIDESNGDVTFNTDAAVIKSKSNLTLDSNGEITDISYTPEKPGEYVFLLSSVESGNGLTVTEDGNLTFNVLNDSTTLLGVEVVTVQTTNSNVTLPEEQTPAFPGDKLAFNAQSNLQDEPTTHAVVLYDNTTFEKKLITLNTTSSSAELTNGTILGNVTGTSDGQPFFLDFNVSTNGTVHNISTKGSLDNVSATIGVVTSGNATDTVNLTVPTGIPFDGQKQKAFQWVHVAVSDDNMTNRSTDKGTIDVRKPKEKFPNITLSPAQYDFGDVRKGSADTKDFTVTNDGNVTLDITSTDITGQTQSFTITSGGGQDTLEPSNSKTITVEFSPETTGENVAKIQVDSNDTTTTADLKGAGLKKVSPPPEEEPEEEPTEPPVEEEADVNVTQDTPDNATVEVDNVQAGDSVNVTLPRDWGTQQVWFRSIQLQMTNTTNVSQFILNLSQQSSPPTDTPALSLTGEVSRYLTITHANISNEDVDSVEFQIDVSGGFLEAGEPPSNINLNRFSDDVWARLPTEHVSSAQGNHTLQATSPGLSVFAVAVGHPEFEIQSTEISPTSITIGETATVTATIENIGDGEGVYEANLTSDSTIKATQNVSIPANETATIEFDVSPEEAGDYRLALNGQDIGTLTVEAVTTTPTPPTTTEQPPTTTPPTTTPPPKESPGLGLGIFILIGIIIAILYRYREVINEQFE